MTILRTAASVSLSLILGALPAAARGHGPGIVFTCVSGKVTRAGALFVTNGPPKGFAFVATAPVGADAAAVCDLINMSAQVVGNFKTDTEGKTVVVVYGADVRLNRVPDGMKITQTKF